MPPPTDPADAQREESRTAALVACACVLQVAESLLPHPIPGVRLGLANVMTVVALLTLGAAAAFRVALLRTIVSSVILGTFLSPTFLLSFSGALASTVVMVVLHAPARWIRLRFGPIGLSVAGSVSHVLAQLVIVYLLFVQSPGVWLLWPWLVLSGVAMGILSGAIAIQAGNRLAAGGLAQLATPAGGAAVPGTPAPIRSFLHRVRPEYKVAGAAALALALVIVRQPIFFGATLVVLVGLAAAARVRAAALLVNFRRLAPLLVFSLLMPAIFTRWGRPLVVVGPVTITDQGIAAGITFLSRLVLIFVATSLVGLTTPPRDVARGIEVLLTPLRLVRVRTAGLARTVEMAWSLFPVLWSQARRLAVVPPGTESRFVRFVRTPGTVVANLYALAESLGDAGRPNA